MYISASHSPTIKELTVKETHIPSQPDWNYCLNFGMGTQIYLSRTELVSLTNQATRLIADAWADEAWAEKTDDAK